MLAFRIIHGSSQKVPVIRDSTIALACTSPPYGKAKAYARDDPQNVGNYEYSQYFDMVKPIYEEVFRVLMRGRKFIVNITDLPDEAATDGRFTYYDYGQKTVELCRKVGFELEETVLWIKGRNRSGGTPGTLPYPPSPMLLNNFEFCYIFRKPGETEVYNISEEEREASKMSGEFLKDVLYTSWDIHPETTIRWHPAPYPVELPSRFIQLYTYVGETVYDPFGGTGTTMLAAKKAHRSATICEIGYDTPDDKSWLDHIKERVGWLDGNMASNEVTYEVVTAEGDIVRDIVKGKGTKKLQEVLGYQQLDKFSEDRAPDVIEPSVILEHDVRKVDAEVKQEEGEVWNKDKDWKKQKSFF